MKLLNASKWIKLGDAVNNMGKAESGHFKRPNLGYLAYTKYITL